MPATSHQLSAVLGNQSLGFGAQPPVSRGQSYTCNQILTDPLVKQMAGWLYTIRAQHHGSIEVWYVSFIEIIYAKSSKAGVAELENECEEARLNCDHQSS